MKRIFVNFIKKVPLVRDTGVFVKSLYIEKCVKKKLRNLILNKKDNEKYVFIFLCDKYGNLGDVALRYSQRKFLEKYYSEYTQILVDEFDLKYGKSFLDDLVRADDLITIVGGGNMGNQYMGTENDRRYVISHFPNNKIISFPQSIYFTSDSEGEIEKKKTMDIYDNHNDLTVLLRDKISYEIAKNIFKNTKIYLTPDIVLTLNEFDYDFKRRDILFLTRKDVEKKITQQDLNNIVHFLKKNKETIIYSDTVIPEQVEVHEQFHVLEKKLKQISSAKLVVTDRLHGMIFCAITNTPCIVLPNYNHKIAAQYEWIKDLNFIEFLEDLDSFNSAYEKLRSVEVIKFNNEFVYKHLEKAFEHI